LSFQVGNNIEKILPPCNHLDTGVLRLPDSARNQADDWLMPSQGWQPEHTCDKGGGGGGGSVYNSMLIWPDINGKYLSVLDTLGSMFPAPQKN